MREREKREGERGSGRGREEVGGRDRQRDLKFSISLWHIDKPDVLLAA